MYTTQPQLHPATVCGVYWDNDVRLTLAQLAASVQHPISELIEMGVRPGEDWLVGRPEIAFLEKQQRF